MSGSISITNSVAFTGGENDSGIGCLIVSSIMSYVQTYFEVLQELQMAFMVGWIATMTRISARK